MPDPTTSRRPGLGLYKLDGHTPVRCDDVVEWGQWLAADSELPHSSRVVARTAIGDLTVSTVFLAIDHNWAELGDGTPVLFETMVFGPGGSDYGQDRCSTWEEAEAQHADTVQLVTAVTRHAEARGALREGRGDGEHAEREDLVKPLTVGDLRRAIEGVPDGVRVVVRAEAATDYFTAYVSEASAEYQDDPADGAPREEFALDCIDMGDDRWSGAELEDLNEQIATRVDERLDERAEADLAEQARKAGAL